MLKMSIAKRRSCWTLISKLKTLLLSHLFNILDALKNIKCGKSSSIDGISTEHSVFAHSSIHGDLMMVGGLMRATDIHVILRSP